MKLSVKQEAIIKSYLRGVLTAVSPLFAISCKDGWAYLAAVVAGVIAPALRAIDKNDPAFGLVADALVVEAKTKVKKKVVEPDTTK
jgi:hypothetical protein